VSAAARRGAAELPLLVVAVILLSTAADILPPDSLVGAGEIRLNLARILILAGFAALVYTEGARRELFGARVGLPLALLLVAGLVATAKWDTWPRYRFLVEGVALFYLTFAVLRSRPETRESLVLVAVVALSVAALVGIAQVSQDQATGFYRQDCVPVTDPSGTVPPGSHIRAVGTFANPNVLAGYLLLLVPLALVALAALRGSAQLRLAVGLAAAAGYLGVALTYSRAAAIFAVVALAAGVAGSRLPHRRYLLGLAAALVVLVALIFGSCGSEATAGYGRKQEWRDTMEVVGDHPAYGIGLGRLGSVLREKNPRSNAHHAHNLFLTWWAEAGTGALIAWLWLFGALLWRSARSALAGVADARGALVALVGFAGFSLLDHPANVDRVALAFWIVAAFAAASAAPRTVSARA
jgi:O-antigen ligase/polysaccharide polymerase Wzy-like membrane protein